MTKSRVQISLPESNFQSVIIDKKNSLGAGSKDTSKVELKDKIDLTAI